MIEPFGKNVAIQVHVLHSALAGNRQHIAVDAPCQIVAPCARSRYFFGRCEQCKVNTCKGNAGEACKRSCGENHDRNENDAEPLFCFLQFLIHNKYPPKILFILNRRLSLFYIFAQISLYV